MIFILHCNLYKNLLKLLLKEHNQKRSNRAFSAPVIKFSSGHFGNSTLFIGSTSVPSSLSHHINLFSLDLNAYI